MVVDRITPPPPKKKLENQTFYTLNYLYRTNSPLNTVLDSFDLNPHRWAPTWHPVRKKIKINSRPTSHIFPHANPSAIPNPPCFYGWRRRMESDLTRGGSGRWRRWINTSSAGCAELLLVASLSYSYHPASELRNPYPS